MMRAREEELKKASQMLQGWLHSVSATVGIESHLRGAPENCFKTVSTDASFVRGSSEPLSARTGHGASILEDHLTTTLENACTGLDLGSVKHDVSGLRHAVSGLKTSSGYVLDDPLPADAHVYHENLRVALLSHGRYQEADDWYRGAGCITR